MGKKKTNLSKYSKTVVPSGKAYRIGIVVAEWNPEITNALLDGAIKTLLAHKCEIRNLKCVTVPGSFELPYGASLLAKNKKIDAIICLGCVIQGETKHFDFICNACANGIVQVSLEYKKPVVFGVLTPNSMAQAKARAGGKHGNKGVEAAVTALKLLGIH